MTQADIEQIQTAIGNLTNDLIPALQIGSDDLGKVYEDLGHAWKDSIKQSAEKVKAKVEQLKNDVDARIKLLTEGDGTTKGLITILNDACKDYGNAGDNAEEQSGGTI